MKGRLLLLLAVVHLVVIGSFHVLGQSATAEKDLHDHDHAHAHDDHEHDHDHVAKTVTLGHDEHDHHDHDEHEHEHDHSEHDHDEHDHHDHEDHHDHAEHEHAHEPHDHNHAEHDHHDHDDHAHEHHEEHEHEHHDEHHDHAHEDHHDHAEHEHEHVHDAQPIQREQHDHKHGGHKCPFHAAKEAQAHAEHKHHDHGHKKAHDHSGGHKCPFHAAKEAHAHDEHDHAHDHHKREEKPAQSVLENPRFNHPPSAQHFILTNLLFFRSWLYAIGATIFISAAPVGILPFVPLDSSAEKRPFLNVLLSFAVGGLLGDVFLHLLPHSMSPHDHDSHGGHDDHGHDDHGHDDHGHGGHGGDELTVGLFVLAGILTFFLVEKFVRANGHNHSHGHGHSHGKKDNKQKKEGNEKNKETSKKGKDDKKVKKSEEEPHEIKTGGWLNLVADATHNFTDGLALASSFQASTTIGLTTTVAVLLHEIPHEIGDFAILLQSGFPRRKAMYLQFATGIGALAGCLLGLVAESFGSFIEWILPFTAGGFIYIATVDVIPDLLEDTNLWQSIKEALAAATGVALMVLVSYIEHTPLFA